MSETIKFVNGSEITLIPSEDNIRGVSSKNIEFTSREVECEALEDICRQEWMHEIVCIEKGQKFTAEHYGNDGYVIVEGHGFKDGVEYIPMSKIKILGSVEQ